MSRRRRKPLYLNRSGFFLLGVANAGVQDSSKSWRSPSPLVRQFAWSWLAWSVITWSMCMALCKTGPGFWSRSSALMVLRRRVGPAMIDGFDLREPISPSLCGDGVSLNWW